MEKILAELADKQAITELIYTYCRAIDRRDVPLGHSIWHDDGYADYGEQFYQGSGQGVIDRICGCHPYLVNPSHQVGNILIELDGDKAGSEAYVMVSVQMERDGKILQMDTCARYLDVWERRQGRWGLVRRMVSNDMYTIHEVRHHADFEGCSIPPADDPSYQVLTRRKWGAGRS
ncbi:MAG TPA: nuclear transport factor 2 family protein [Steroidobacteraceae bacterium]|nr:nuclear transport factor 2 family protein [Steroidobacteraceae bacterium]